MRFGNRIGRLLRTGVTSIVAVFVASSLAACGSANSSSNIQGGTSASKDTVNVAVSSVLSSSNPLLFDASLLSQAVNDLSYLPLVNVNRDFEFSPQLATSIKTDDNIHFTVNLDPKAVWSDGSSVTSDDLVYTVLKLASPVIGNTSTGFSTLLGTGDDGFVREGATYIEGVKKIDEHTVEFTTKAPMALSIFESDYGTGIHTVPKKLIEKLSDEELLKTTIFNNPQIVDGPYRISKVDLKHYIQFKANDGYYKGAPKIENLNFKILTASQALSGLQSGEVDVVQPPLGEIDQTDYSTLKSLSNITTTPSKRVTHEMLFFNTRKITDERIRQAFLYGIDREKIIKGFVGDNAEIVDGFASKQSPIYDKSSKVASYDPDKARKLVDEAKADGWDASKTLTYYVPSSDSIILKAADYIAAQVKTLGINLQVKSVDLSTLLKHAGNGDFDLLSVQYTFFPLNPVSDVNYLISKDGWTGFDDSTIKKTIDKIQTDATDEEARRDFAVIDGVIHNKVPAFTLFNFGGLGAVNKRLKNASIDTYGTFLNVNKWDIK